jgi:hypothetical protein
MKAEQAQHDEYWREQARRLIREVIESLLNSARAEGKAPHWSFQQLTQIFASCENVCRLVREYGTSDGMLSALLDPANCITADIYSLAARYIDPLAEVGEQWADAQRRGRSISLKEWARYYRGSVLVLPSTESKPEVYEALNRILFRTLTNIALDYAYSTFTDRNGIEHLKKWYFFIDGLGRAGRPEDLVRLMSEGRWHGVQVVLEMRQLSHIPEAADAIFALCHNVALVRTSDLPLPSK